MAFETGKRGKKLNPIISHSIVLSAKYIKVEELTAPQTCMAPDQSHCAAQGYSKKPIISQVYKTAILKEEKGTREHENGRKGRKRFWAKGKRIVERFRRRGGWGNVWRSAKGQKGGGWDPRPGPKSAEG